MKTLSQIVLLKSEVVIEETPLLFLPEGMLMDQIQMTEPYPYNDLKLVLQKLDTTFGQNFQVRSALNYLKDVAKYARLAQKDFDQARSS